MSDNKRKNNNYVEIDDLLDAAVDHASVRRSKTLLSLNDEVAQSISGGKLFPYPMVHGVIINSCPQPAPFPVVHGVIINPNP